MIRIVCDSTFGVPEDYAKENNIKIVNLKLILDGEVTDEGSASEWTPFYNKLKVSKNFPTTSQPSPQDFCDAIDAIFEEDKNAEVFVLTIGSGLSGTINAATIAVNSYEGKKVKAVDSMSASAGSFIILEEIVELIKQNKTFEEIEELIPVIQSKTNTLFIPPTLEYLKRGGRVSGLIATLASVLQIKPIFQFKQNVVTIPKKVLGLGRAIVELVSQIPKNIKKLYLFYCSENAHVEKVRERISLANIIEPTIYSVSPVFGCHVGPGAIGISYLEN